MWQCLCVAEVFAAFAKLGVYNAGAMNDKEVKMRCLDGGVNGMFYPELLVVVGHLESPPTEQFRTLVLAYHHHKQESSRARAVFGCAGHPHHRTRHTHPG